MTKPKIMLYQLTSAKKSKTSDAKFRENYCKSWYEKSDGWPTF